MSYHGDEKGFSKTVAVDRDSPVEVQIRKIAWGLRADEEVFKIIPLGEGTEATVSFVRLRDLLQKLDRAEISVDELEKICASDGKRFADPRAYVAVQAADFDFANHYSTATYWKNNGIWYSLAFGRWCGVRYTYVVPCNDPGQDYVMDAVSNEWIALEPLESRN